MEVTKKMQEFIEKLATRAIEVGSIGEVSEYIEEYTNQVIDNDFECMLSFAIEEKFEIPSELLKVAEKLKQNKENQQ